MADPIGARITGVEHKVNDIREAVERIATNRDGSQSVSHVTLSAGGIGTWIACAAAVGSFLTAIFMGFLYVDLRREQQRTQDHISVIYQLIPDLRKMVDDELNKPSHQR